MKRNLLERLGLSMLLAVELHAGSQAQIVTAGKPKTPIAAAPKAISPDLFGVFFEDLSYAADGGLYAELVQNRSFEYTPADHDGWQSLTAWQFLREGYAIGNVSVETNAPVHPNNPHYVVLKKEDNGRGDVGLRNGGFDIIPVKAGEQYDFSLFARLLSGNELPLAVQLRGRKGAVLAEATVRPQTKDWQKYTAVLTPKATTDTASLVVLAHTPGTIALDNISLFPHHTFKNRPNGLRADLAQAVADLQPKFVRFPGGCVAHGDGLGNIYHWQNTVGSVETRIEQRNLWNYHQTVGLGYFEYFQFCEDIGAKPLPVVAAAVCCQNSGGTWRIGGVGQQGLLLAEMPEYVQEVLDLIEYANGPATSTWGAKRAAAGHPAPFNLEYIGIGNEDKQTPVFRERFKIIYNAVRQKYPKIIVIGTVGPFPAGEDYDQGWAFANELGLPLVDEHYYENPKWFAANSQRYDSYDRSKSKVYIGEYASKGNAFYNALAEAAYMTTLERNGEVVQLASYAPLLARLDHTSWNPNLIYFNGTQVCRTPNYYVQQLFSTNQGTRYVPNAISSVAVDTLAHVASSCVVDEGSHDVILKLVNTGATPAKFNLNVAGLVSKGGQAQVTILTGELKAINTIDKPEAIKPTTGKVSFNKTFAYDAPPHSLSVLRIPGKRLR